MSINAVSSNPMNSRVTSTLTTQTGNVENLEKIPEKRTGPHEKMEGKEPVLKEYSKEETFELIEKANKAFKTFDRRFEFSVHEKTKQIMVKVIDMNNDEVIRELPSEKILDMVAAMWEVAGIMIDTKA